MHRLLWFVCLLVASSVFAQVPLPAVVADNSGQSVHGIQKTDFSVKCDKGATFDSAAEVPPASVTGFSNPNPVFILYDVAIDPMERGRVSNVLLQYLRDAAASRLPVMLIENTGQELKVIHDLSTDSRVLGAAVDRVITKSSGDVSSDADFARKVDQETEGLRELMKPRPSHRFGPVEIEQLDGLRLTASTLARHNGRKLLVWVTGGPLVMGPDEMRNPPDWIFPYQSQVVDAYQSAMDTLNNNRVSVYPIQVAGRTVPPGMTGSEFKETAKRTGGRFLGPLHDVKSFEASIAEERDRFGSFYILSFSVDPKQKKSWVKTDIKSTRRDLRVEAADGFIGGR